MQTKSVIELVKKELEGEQTTLDLFTDRINLTVEPITAITHFPKVSKDKPYAIDLFTHLGFLDSVEVLSGDSYLVNTGIAIALPKETYGPVTIQNIPNSKGNISLYKGSQQIPLDKILKREYDDLMILVHNNTDKTITLQAGEPVAQIIFHKSATNINIERVRELPVDKHIHFGTVE